MSCRKQAADRRHLLAGSRKVADRHYLLAGSHKAVDPHLLAGSRKAVDPHLLAASRKADQFRSCVIVRVLRMRMGYCHQAVERYRIRACLGIEGNYSRFS